MRQAFEGGSEVVAEKPGVKPAPRSRGVSQRFEPGPALAIEDGVRKRKDPRPAVAAVMQQQGVPLAGQRREGRQRVPPGQVDRLARLVMRAMAALRTSASVRAAPDARLR